MMISNEWQTAKRNARADQEAQAAADARSTNQQQAQANALASQEYVVRLDDEIRKNLPDTFVRYRYDSGWHTWYIDPSLSVSVTVNQRNRTIRRYTINDNGVGALQPFEINDPAGFAGQITDHIAKALERPAV